MVNDSRYDETDQGRQSSEGQISTERPSMKDFNRNYENAVDSFPKSNASSILPRIELFDPDGATGVANTGFDQSAPRLAPEAPPSRSPEQQPIPQDQSASRLAPDSPPLRSPEQQPIPQDRSAPRRAPEAPPLRSPEQQSIPQNQSTPRLAPDVPPFRSPDRQRQPDNRSAPRPELEAQQRQVASIRLNMQNLHSSDPATRQRAIGALQNTPAALGPLLRASAEWNSKAASIAQDILNSMGESIISGLYDAMDNPTSPEQARTAERTLDRIIRKVSQLTVFQDGQERVRRVVGANRQTQLDITYNSQGHISRVAATGLTLIRNEDGTYRSPEFSDRFFRDVRVSRQGDLSFRSGGHGSGERTVLTVLRPNGGMHLYDEQGNERINSFRRR